MRKGQENMQQKADTAEDYIQYGNEKVNEYGQYAKDTFEDYIVNPVKETFRQGAEKVINNISIANTENLGTGCKGKNGRVCSKRQRNG